MRCVECFALLCTLAVQCRARGLQGRRRRQRHMGYTTLLVSISLPALACSNSRADGALWLYTHLRGLSSNEHSGRVSWARGRGSSSRNAFQSLQSPSSCRDFRTSGWEGDCEGCGGQRGAFLVIITRVGGGGGSWVRGLKGGMLHELYRQL